LASNNQLKKCGAFAFSCGTHFFLLMLKTSFFYDFQHFPTCFFIIDFSTSFPPKHMSSFLVFPTKTPSQAWADLAPMTFIYIIDGSLQ
jgi:hypothetical protein